LTSEHRFHVSVARRADPRVKSLRGKVRDGFVAAVNDVRQRGCEAGGIRMRADDCGDHHVCERRFYGRWRMHLIFATSGEIVISWVGQHAEDEDVHAEGARDIPGPSGIGRARDDQPRCCDRLDEPPADDDLVELVNRLRPPRRR